MVSKEACALWPFTDIAVKYQQIFAISQALPGSASIKMVFTINVIRGGFMAGFISFLLFRYSRVPNLPSSSIFSPFF